VPEQKAVNVLKWSLYLFFLFIGVQVAVNLPFALQGSPLSPVVGVFTWFAVSAGSAWGMLSKHNVSRSEAFLIQGLACFYLTAVGSALALRADADINVELVSRVIGVAVVLWCSGVGGFYLSQALRSRHSATI